MDIFEKIKDLLLFREGTEEEDDYSRTPIVTLGSIFWGIMLRGLIVMLLMLFLIKFPSVRNNWSLLLFSLWFIAAYPAYRQYQLYYKRIEKFEEETLCGSCKNFDPGARLCTIYDEHISKDHIPCEGQNWEPKSQDY